MHARGGISVAHSPSRASGIIHAIHTIWQARSLWGVSQKKIKKKKIERTNIYVIIVLKTFILSSILKHREFFLFCNITYYFFSRISLM